MTAISVSSAPLTSNTPVPLMATKSVSTLSTETRDPPRARPASALLSRAQRRMSATTSDFASGVIDHRLPLAGREFAFHRLVAVPVVVVCRATGRGTPSWPRWPLPPSRQTCTWRSGVWNIRRAGSITRNEHPAPTTSARTWRRRRELPPRHDQPLDTALHRHRRRVPPARSAACDGSSQGRTRRQRHGDPPRGYRRLGPIVEDANSDAVPEARSRDVVETALGLLAESV